LARKFKQGIFTPKYPEKWHSKSQIVYRSSWELLFFQYADKNVAVTKVASEEVVVPYYFELDKKMHRYFPDILMEYVDKNGSTRTIMIEIKPHAETIMPVKKKGMSEKTFIDRMVTYQKNQAKWEAAQRFCDEKNITFSVMTEYHLGIKKAK
jgi:hypothetical protein